MGRDFKNKISASFALFIRQPDMEPLLSNKNMNSHYAVDKSTGKFIIRRSSSVL